MPSVFDFLPDVLLAVVGLLGFIRTGHFLDAFAAMAALLEEDVEELYAEVGLFIQERWEEDFAALDVRARGQQYFGIQKPDKYSRLFLVCRLAHCRVSEREFETVAAWKKHVALARTHLEDAFCGNCGHYLIVPPETEAANIKAFLTAHKKERCVGASKTIIQRRRAEVTRLEGLMRTTSHILVPG
uniref:Zf-3CxxC domain-containing protein n=1 Tax=Ascaris lumbricoides TaxID=6252 RepID=A0A0M3HW55_ASCLU